MNIINTLMTELWDRNFSQQEIRTAFQAALDDMPRYTAGVDRRAISIESHHLPISDRVYLSSLTAKARSVPERHQSSPA
jgi:hypothetical protein